MPPDAALALLKRIAATVERLAVSRSWMQRRRLRAALLEAMVAKADDLAHAVGSLLEERNRLAGDDAAKLNAAWYAGMRAQELYERQCAAARKAGKKPPKLPKPPYSRR